jgi:hypothetical protein
MKALRSETAKPIIAGISMPWIKITPKTQGLN